MLNSKYLLNILFCVIIQSEHGDQKESRGSTPNQSETGFGGVLYLRLGHKLINHSDIAAAAKFATKQGRQLVNPCDSKREGYTITTASVSKVVYTQDGRTPFIIPALNPHSGQSMAHPLIWGMLYTFSLTHMGTPHTHHAYTVLKYWDASYHIFQHTYHAAQPQTGIRPLPVSARPSPAPPRLDVVTTYTQFAYTSSETRGGVHTLGVVPEVKGEPPPIIESEEALLSDLPVASGLCYGCGDLGPGGDLGSHIDLDHYVVSDLANQGAVSSCTITATGWCQCTCHISDIHSQSCHKPIAKLTFLHSINCDKKVSHSVKPSEPLKSANKLPSKKCITNDIRLDHASDPAGFRHVYTAQAIDRNKTMTFKVLNFNIWNVNILRGGDADYVQRLRHLAIICRTSEADVIGFQEVRFQDGSRGPWGPNQMRHLVDLLPGYQYVYQPAQVQADHLPNMVVEGVAFLSKHPITAHDRLLLQRDLRDPADGHQRVLLHIEVQLPQVGKVHFFNTHLSLSHRARATSVLQIVPYMNTFTGPAFLMGDFNSEAHNIEVQFLDGRAKLQGRRTEGLHDVWRLKHGLHNPGFTFNTLDTHLTKRIDLIFMREHKQVSLVDVQILDDKMRRAQAASDHLPLFAEFSLTS